MSSDSDRLRNAVRKTWHGAARPQWAGTRLLEFLLQLWDKVGGEGCENSVDVRLQVEARTGAEILVSGLSALEARLYDVLEVGDRELLTAAVSVMQGMARTLDQPSGIAHPTIKTSPKDVRLDRKTTERSVPAVEQEHRTVDRWPALDDLIEGASGDEEETVVVSETDLGGTPQTVTTDLESGPNGVVDAGALYEQLLRYAEDVARLYRAQRELHSRFSGMEQTMQVTEKAAAAGLMSGGVLHDVNHYLAVIRSAAELLQTDASSLTETSREDLGAIVESAGRAGTLIHRFQVLARPGADDDVLVSLVDVLLEARTLLKRQLTKRGIALVLEVNPELPPVSGDPAALEEVVLNLLSNAMEVLKSDGHIRVVADTAAGRDGGQDVVLLVEDDGPGIKDEIKDRIFEPFVTGREGGTGLGLYLVKRIVDRHKGSITLYSTPGDGAKFLIRLPVANAHGMMVDPG